MLPHYYRCCKTVTKSQSYGQQWYCHHNQQPGKTVESPLHSLFHWVACLTRRTCPMRPRSVTSSACHIILHSRPFEVAMPTIVAIPKMYCLAASQASHCLICNRHGYSFQEMKELASNTTGFRGRMIGWCQRPPTLGDERQKCPAISIWKSSASHNLPMAQSKSGRPRHTRTARRVLVLRSPCRTPCM